MSKTMLPESGLVLILVFCALPSAHLDQSKCNTSAGWRCTKFEDCPWARKAIQNRQRPTICYFQGKDPVVCCPPVGVERPKTVSSSSEGNIKPSSSDPAILKSNNKPEVDIAWTKCQEYGKYVFILSESPVPGVNEKENRSSCTADQSTLIVNGEEAKEKEFPHMARIGFIGRKKVEWKCGGSLISEQFVLSAAHCAEHQDYGKATWAALGGHFLEAKNEKFEGRFEVKISEIIIYPDFNMKRHFYNDICLFKLAQPVELSDSIRPICLPTEPSLPQKAVASGWGANSLNGKSSKYLQKAKLSVISREECNKHYKNIKLLPRGIAEDSQLCTFERDKDACQGDSGGPLQVYQSSPYCTYKQIGIISFGKSCEGSPGVYTKVHKYMPWIKSFVWP